MGNLNIQFLRKGRVYFTNYKIKQLIFTKTILINISTNFSQCFPKKIKYFKETQYT